MKRAAVLGGLVLAGWLLGPVATGAVQEPAPHALEIAEPVDLSLHSLNGLLLPEAPKNAAHSFLVGGHLYGSPENVASIFPSPSLLANLERLNASGASYFVSQGDIVRFTTPRHLAGLREAFVKRLEMPLWNAPGNHDFASRHAWLLAFPEPTVGQFLHGPVLHVVLDSEADSGRIAGKQLEYLRAILAAARTVERVKCVAIHSHKLLWADGREELRVVATNVNSRSGYVAVDDDGFAREVLPAVRELAAHKPVAWFSGDIGIRGRLPLFYHREPDVELTWIAVGMGDTADDSLVQVHVSADGEFRYEVLRMDGLPSMPLESFDLEFWKKRFAGR